ncbi:uncharacterized protein LOC126653962 [Mercurialis annua]|uniref:uncharacterized protein LOC126653962 n=1 Tax=Mercurialis annua TaxID=3986 RepID=UPI002160DFC4|nr:uncharacterized protein LOC126653962 [Mercurialis annua]
MDEIQHKFVDVRGVKLHIAEIGTGSSVVMFIHGFPEIWYSWRYQMIAAANAGYRAIAPDLRGYGLSDPHPQPEKASFNDFVEDAITILDHFQIHKAFLVGKDFGSWPVYLLSLFYPARISGVVSLGVPFFIPNPRRYKELLPEGFYISRWKEPGRAEADFSRYDVRTVWKNIYILFSRSEIPIAEKDKEIMDLVEPSAPPPKWLTTEDLQIYTTSYEKSGFDSPMQVPYKGLPGEFTLTDPKIHVPVLLIIGGKDYFLKFPGIQDYITTGKMKDFVGDLEMESMPDGTHFIQEQFPDQVNKLITAFFEKHT